MKRLYPIFILILFLSVAAVSASDLNVTDNAATFEDESVEVISISDVGDDLNELSEVDTDSNNSVQSENLLSEDSSQSWDYDYYRFLVNYYRDNQFGDLNLTNPSSYPVQGPQEVYTWLVNNLKSSNIDYSKLEQYLNARIPNATVYFADDFLDLNDNVQDAYKYDAFLRSLINNGTGNFSDYEKYYDMFSEIYNSIRNDASDNNSNVSWDLQDVTNLAKEIYDYTINLYPELEKYGGYFLIADDMVKYYGDSKRFEATTFAKGSVIFTINGVEYTRPIVNNTASIAINLAPGEYDIKTYCPQTDNSITNSITVLSTIDSKDLTKYYKDTSRFEIGLLDSNGDTINASSNVTFNINGVFYTRQYVNGLAALNINLNPGTYIITTTNPFNGEKKSNKVTVFSYIESYDLVKYYKNDSQFVVKVLNKTSGSVTFNINGVFYTRQINQTGHAKLNINLNPGNYIITSICGDYVNSNNITVLSTLEAADLDMYIWDGSKFLVKVLDGNGNRLGGVDVTFNINGVFYTRGTNENGIARLNINLDAVGDFIITSTYNGLSISNNIHIKPIQISEYDTILKSIIKNAIFDVINDTGINIVSYDVDSDGNYVVHLGDLTGNIIDSITVTKDGIIIK